jgi:hypothetical protein
VIHVDSGSKHATVALFAIPANCLANYLTHSRGSIISRRQRDTALPASPHSRPTLIGSVARRATTPDGRNRRTAKAWTKHDDHPQATQVPILGCDGSCRADPAVAPDSGVHAARSPSQGRC